MGQDLCPGGDGDIQLLCLTVAQAWGDTGGGVQWLRALYYCTGAFWKHTGLRLQE